MQYLWQFYLLLGLILIQGLCLPIGGKMGRSLFVWLCFLELAFIAGFRAWDIGNDTMNYISTFFATINHLDLYRSHMEKGYLLYNKILSFFTSNPQAILIANAFVITGSILGFIKKYSSMVLLSVLLFVVLQFGSTLNIMREYLAVAIILLSFPFIIKRQFIPFALGCLLATTFHMSALLAIFLYFLYDLPFKTKYLLSVFLGAFFVLVFLAPILEKIIDVTGRYSSYQGNILLGEETKIASLFKTLVQLAILSFCYFSYKYVYKPFTKDNTHLPVQFLLWTSVVAFCLQMVSIRGTVLERLVPYFSIFSLISIPLFIHYYPKKSRVLIAICMMGCFVLYQSIIFVYRPGWNYVLPFKFCF